MTHPNPTTAPKAPPLLGEGMGMGGIALALAVALTPPATAQIIPTGIPAADILLSRAIAEHRTFLTCSALDPETHRLIRANWQRDTAAAVAILTENAVPPEAIAAFTAAADPAALALPPDTPLAEVRDYCQAQTDWSARMTHRDFTELATALPKAFP